MDTDNDNATEQPTGDVHSRVNEPIVDPLRRVLPSELELAPAKAVEKKPLDPLRRVLVPIEKRMADGNFRLRTTDRTRYTRNAHTGTIFRADPKPVNKHARRRLREA